MAKEIKEITATVSHLRPTADGNTRAIATVQIERPPLTLGEIRLVLQDGQAPFVLPPQRSWRSQGRRFYRPLVQWPKSWNSPILKAVLAAYEAQQAAAQAERPAGIGGDA